MLHQRGACLHRGSRHHIENARWQTGLMECPPKWMELSGAIGDGFSTTVLPLTRAGITSRRGWPWGSSMACDTGGHAERHPHRHHELVAQLGVGCLAEKTAPLLRRCSRSCRWLPEYRRRFPQDLAHFTRHVAGKSLLCGESGIQPPGTGFQRGQAQEQAARMRRHRGR